MPKAPVKSSKELSSALKAIALMGQGEPRPAPRSATPADGRTSTSRGAPLWDGPEADTPNGGVTQSLLGNFLVCRERFRIKVVEGLQSADSFRRALEFGNLWHILEENFARTGQTEKAFSDLHSYAALLCKKYPLQQEEIFHWYNVCKTQFPYYTEYWRKQPDVKERTPLLQEQAFNVPYRLPSGRVVRLRGKWDSVDLIGKGRSAGIYIQENKTKGDINEQQLKHQLSSGFDLQTGLYAVAFIEQKKENGIERPFKGSLAPFRGVRYNVIRRPLSGGRGSIVRHKPTKSNPAGESAAEFYARLGGIIAAEPEYFFMRWKIELLPADVERFRRECLDPILEQICDWWDWITYYPITDHKSPFGLDYRNSEGNELNNYKRFQHHHFRFPYGVYSQLLDGGETEIDEHMTSGSTLGLTRATNLFPELQ
jgi:hypothetical protein